jgi:replicative DNA helicase
MIDDPLRAVPPHDAKAEIAVLGGIVLDNRVLDDALEVITADDFYLERNRAIFRAMIELALRGAPIDAVSLSAALAGQPDVIDGGYIAEIAAEVPSAAAVGHYARIVKGKAALRELAFQTACIFRECHEPRFDVEAFLNEAEQRVFDACRCEGRNAMPSAAAELMADATERMRARSDGKMPEDVVTSGFEELDTFTGGLEASQLIVIAARPSMGKTALA